MPCGVQRYIRVHKVIGVCNKEELMGRVRLALYTQDERYAGAFAEYCGKYEKERMTVRTYTNCESVKPHILSGALDVVLTDEIQEVSELAECGCHVALLHEERFASGISCPVIFKYQRMDDILKQVYQIMAEDISKGAGVCSSGTCESRFIGCFSPCYEEVREQYARALAECMAGEGKTLFINFAMFTSYDNQGEEGLSELLYYAAGEESAIAYKLPTLVQNVAGYDSLPGVSNYIDLYDLEGNVATSLLARIESLGVYKTVIVDVGLVGDVADDVLTFCSDIIMPVPCEADNRRLTHLKNDYAKGVSGIMENIRQMRLPEWWDHNVLSRVRWVSDTYAG